MIRVRYMWLILFFTCVCWFVGGISYNYSFEPLAGIFGETAELQNVFAPVGTLFSAFASCGAGLAVFIQAQTNASEKFENNFYNLISQVTETRKQMSARPIAQDGTQQSEVSGVLAFQILHQQLEAITTFAYSDLVPRHQQYITNSLRNEIRFVMQVVDNQEEQFKLLYSTFSEHTNYCLYSYFRQLYHVFKFIDRNISSIKERHKYFAIARAQLSPHEYSLFYYNGLTQGDCEDGHATSKIYELIIKNALLHNHTEALIFDNDHAGVYPPSAHNH